MYKCLNCGNDKEFLCDAVSHGIALIDNKGEFLDWDKDNTGLDNPVFSAPHTCDKCKSQNIVDLQGKILFWRAHGKYGFLSNFFRHPDGSTNEHYFQSKKFEGTKWEQYILDLETPGEAAHQGRRRDLPLREDWEQIKEDVMYTGLLIKFTLRQSMTEALLSTGDAELIEDSPYDYYWGIGKTGLGKNRLGILLMRLREAIRVYDSGRPIHSKLNIMGTISGRIQCKQPN